jgi:hypothetical protein
MATFKFADRSYTGKWSAASSGQCAFDEMRVGFDELRIVVWHGLSTQDTASAVRSSEPT